jgi:hypothetical protein
MAGWAGPIAVAGVCALALCKMMMNTCHLHTGNDAFVA